MRTVVIIDSHRDRDVDAFPSIEQAAAHLEAIDVENDEYRAFDVDGYPLLLGVNQGRVTIQRIPGAMPDKSKVEELLRARLGPSAASMTFDELVRAAQKRSRGWLLRFVDFILRRNPA